MESTFYNRDVPSYIHAIEITQLLAVAMYLSLSMGAFSNNSATSATAKSLCLCVLVATCRGLSLSSFTTVGSSM